MSFGIIISVVLALQMADKTLRAKKQFGDLAPLIKVFVATEVPDVIWEEILAVHV